MEPVSVCLRKNRMRSNTRNRESLDKPESIHDRALHPPDVLVVPVPRLRIDGLTHTSEHSQTAEIVLLDMVGPKTTQQADGSGRGVELGDLILIDSLPVTRRGGINWGGLEDGCCHTVGERTVYDVAVGMFVGKCAK